MNKLQKTEDKIIGIISDTHNLLRPEAIAALEGSDLIIHAGDVCNAQILTRLKDIAPVVAVRGNNDTDEWAASLAEIETVKIGQVSIFIIHDLKEMTIDPTASGFNVVISGHSHKPSLTKREGVLYLNPGSAGRRRFKLPVSVARLKINGKTVAAETIELFV